MDARDASRIERFTPVGPEQDANIADTCSVDMLVPEAFSCAVCLELMVCPISYFPCRHSFCEPCVRLITHAGDPLDILCPICRQAILCSGPNNALKNQIVLGDPIVAIAYEHRLGCFRRQDAFGEMRLPGITRLGILPKIGAWIPRGNLAADYLVRAIFGLITGRNSHEICKDLLRKFFSFLFSATMVLLTPCVYLRNVLQHPSPFSAPNGNDSSLHLISGLLNWTEVANASGHNGTATRLPFKPFGQLSIFPLMVLVCIVLLCVCLVLASSKAALNRFIRGPDPERRPNTYPSVSVAVWFTFLMAMAADMCAGMHISIYMLFGLMPYWEYSGDDVGVWLFSVCALTCLAVWVETLVAMRACVSLSDSNGYLQFSERAKTLRFVLFYVLIWLVLVTLDIYFNFFYDFTAG